MKKLLFALGAISLTAVASTSVVACNKDSGVDINGKVTVTPPTGIAATTTAANSVLLTNAQITDAVAAGFTASTDATVKAAVAGTDYTLSVANPDAMQAAGNLVFTITGKGKLSGKVTFTVVLT